MTFAEKIRAFRQKQKLTEIELARRSGLAPGTIHGYVVGARSPSFAAVVRIAQALGVTCEAFADCDDIAEQSRPRIVPEGEQPPRRPRGRPPKAKQPAGEKPRGRRRRPR